MRKLISLVCIVTIFVLAACSKSDTSPDTTGTPLQFTSLDAADTLLKVNDVTTISATATGDGLNYKWSASYGTFVGSGASVQWTVCHKATFTITCQITDKYNHAESKSVIVRTYN